MSRKMLIDAAHPEETRVVVVNANQVEDFDFESASRKPIRGNIYLAKVTRVEPSLQAAFVEYGGNKHGFLAFNEIHPDYYQIPFEDREELRKAEAAIEKEAADAEQPDSDDENADVGSDTDDIVEEAARKRRQLLRKYKIQEVIKRRQVLLVQVAKEERGNKGAALTTYMSLAGRYCVLMPNTARGGGISRKITQASDRKRLKSAVSELSVPTGMGLIIRTAGASRTKVEIKRDYDYLIRLWETIRELTLSSSAPSLVYEEGDLVKRAIRDLYDKDIEQVLVEGDEAYKQAKGFMKMLMPSHAKKVQHYKEDTPLYLRHQVESQLEEIHSPVSQLKSGGYLVINPTEALVSVDVNSGRSTKERNIEQTALRTNLEAAEEVARQMRLRDLAGLIVIDFIDMEENKNTRQVEKKMRDALKKDRARIQISRISQFGLMEISRQRRRTSLVEGSTQSCEVCGGTGYRRSVESSALLALRSLEEEGVRGRSKTVALSCAADVALYILNEKRDTLRAIEERFSMRILINVSDDLLRPNIEIERIESQKEAARAEIISKNEAQPIKPAADALSEIIEKDDDESEEQDDNTPSSRADETDSEDRPRKRRRRGRRGGRGRRRKPSDNQESQNDQDGSDDKASSDETTSGSGVLDVIEPVEGEDLTSQGKPKRRSRRRKKPETADTQSTDSTSDNMSAETPEGNTPEDAKANESVKPKRRRVRKKADTVEADSKLDAPQVADTPDPEKSDETSPAKPKRTRRRKAPAKADTTSKTVDTQESAAPAKAKAEASSDTPVKSEEVPTEDNSLARPKRSKTRKAPITSESKPASKKAAPAKKPAKAKAESDGKAKADKDESEQKGWWSRSKKLFGSE